MRGKRLPGLTAVLCLLALSGVSSPAGAQNFEILDQQLDANRHGYTVIHVWGSHRQMGRALGEVFAADILDGMQEVRTELGDMYGTARTVIADTDWSARGITEEIAGVVEGIREVEPSADIDDADIMVLNTFGDWGYYGGCRSHQCWGSFVSGATRTLSTRRLDFGTPFQAVLHHVLVAFDPDDGSPRWVNLAWPGYVTVITGVNRYGTLVSLHDYGSSFQIVSGGLLRCVATRLVLCDVPPGLALDRHLAWAEGELASATFTTGTFINYYVPEGLGGVFTCTTAGSCNSARRPRSEYFGGEVLITTNSQTDGTSVPSGGEFMDDYYQQGKPKSLADHFQLMGTGGLHLLSLDYRGEQDMTMWFTGRGLSGRVEVEWSELFAGSPQPDGGNSDAGVADGSGPDGGADQPASDDGPDGGTTSDHAADSSESGADDGSASDRVADSDDDGGGCACATRSAYHPGHLLLLALALLTSRRRRKPRP